MKHASLFFACFVLSAASYAQNDGLFTIVTLSYGTKIDGGAIAVGEEITAASKYISIPADGYLGVVTADGFPYELRQSIPVADVNAFVKSAQPIPTGATLRDVRSLETPLTNVISHLLGDSVFITWEEPVERDRLPGINYTVSLMDRQQTALSEESIDHNWILLNMKQVNAVFGNVAVCVVSGKSQLANCFQVLIDKKDDRKVRLDIERLGDNPSLELLCAVLDINNYQSDRNLVVYKMIRSGKNAPPTILGRYSARLMNRVDMK